MRQQRRRVPWAVIAMATVVVVNSLLIVALLRGTGRWGSGGPAAVPAVPPGGSVPFPRGGPPFGRGGPGTSPVAPGLPTMSFRFGPPMPVAPIEARLANAGSPIRAARQNPFFPGSEFMDVALDPPYAYLTGGLVGLAGYRVETPRQPDGVIRFTPLPGSLLSGRGYRILRVRSGLLAISNTLEGVVLVDVRQPERPAILSELRAMDGAFEGMAVHGERLLVARHRAGLAAYDVSDPARPTQAARLADVKNARDVAVVGDTALVADGPEGLAVVSLAGGVMRLAGRVSTSGDARRVAARAGYAYVAMGHRGIDVLDVTDPARPARVRHLDATGPVFSLAVGDAVLYAGAGPRLAAWSLDDPAAPRAIYDGSLEPARPDGTEPLLTGLAASGPWVVASEWFSALLCYHDRAAAAQVPSEPETMAEAPPGRTGEAAPDFQMEGLDGKSHRLSDFKGRTVLLAFFAPY